MVFPSTCRRTVYGRSINPAQRDGSRGKVEEERERGRGRESETERERENEPHLDG